MDENLGRISFDGLPELNKQVEQLIKELQSLQGQFKQTENASKQNSDAIKNQTQNVGALHGSFTKLAGALGLAMGGYQLLASAVQKVTEAINPDYAVEITSADPNALIFTKRLSI